MQNNLVIVESPAKAKTIGKFLGKDYKVMSSYGHIRDLKQKSFSIDTQTFQPEYEIPEDKQKIVESLRNEAKKTGNVWLASDEDREGEAISWHLAEVLNLDVAKTKRIVFHEITQTAIQEAIAHPRNIDLNLVNAQQARRVLDRIVGFKLSPVLWRKVKPSLSAGRVQSVAVRLIADRENEIRNFQATSSYAVIAQFEVVQADGQTNVVKADLNRRFASEEEARDFLERCKDATFSVSRLEKKPVKRSPAPPFMTSTLQQEAVRKLGYPVALTMRLAQQLYEADLITYMRTDSLRLSEEALAAAKDFIIGRYGEVYYAGSPRRFRAKSGAQDAHEAIRPSNVTLDPETIKGDLTREQYRLYKLIWSRFVACQMADARFDAVQIDTVCAGHTFRATDQVMKFAGYTAVYEEGRDDESEEKGSSLPDLKGDERLKAEKTEKEQHFTTPPPRYTEATLVKAMEERGVGRPSTYASIVATIQDREYVIKKDKRLTPTPLGIVVTDLMLAHFNDIIDVEFTANMEHQLDEVEAGRVEWKRVLREFYSDFHREMTEAEAALDGKRIKVPEEETDEICEICGRRMVIKSGRFGRFLACPGFPECKNTKPIVERMPGRCPKCGSTILKRKSKKGYVYYACERGAECGFMTWDVPTANDCPSCGQTLFKKSGRGQMKPFCINENCKDFLPEDKRGYKRRMPKATTETVETAEEIAEPSEKPKKTTKTKSTTKGTKKA